jgi:hypothetical protein
MKKSVTSLGNVINENVIETDLEKIEKIFNYQIPNNPDGLFSFRGIL